MLFFGLPFDYILTLVPVISLIGILVQITFWFLSRVFWQRRRKTTTTTPTPTITSPKSSSSKTTVGPTILSILLLGLALDAPFMYYSNKTSSNSHHHRPDRLQKEDDRLGDGIYDFVQGKDPRLNDLLKQMEPDLLQGPTSPILFRNRHLQFLPWLIQNEIHRQQGIPFQRKELEVTACQWQTNDGNGSNTCTPDPRMTDIITLDIFPPFSNDDDDKNSTTNDNDNFTKDGFNNNNKTLPIILFIPGLRCYSQDMPGNMIIRRAYAEGGFRSIVVNRRGHTPGQTLRAPRWNLFGDTNDLEQVYWYIKDTLVGDPHVAMFLHGISSGTAVVVSSLGIWDERRRRQEEEEERNKDASNTTTSTTPSHPRRIPTFVASISMTPGYDISRVMQKDRFRFPYNHLFAPLVQEHFVLQNEDVLRSYNSPAVDRILSPSTTSTLQDFVDESVVFAGYRSKQEYYNETNPINNIQEITTPKLVMNSLDDPCCLVDNIYERSPYTWHSNMSYAEIAQESERAMIVVTKTGSHCPFLDTTRTTSNNFFGGILSSLLFPKFMKDPLFGGYMLDSWADRVSIQFYKAALNVYGDRRFL